MIKTRIWAPVIITTILIAGLLTVMVAESAEAKPDKRVFGFGGTTAGGIGGGSSEIWMAGDGDWTKGTDKIKAKGVFKTSDGMDGKWKAITLTDVSVATGSGTCPPCITPTTSADNVVFTAEFKASNGNKFTWDVVVGLGDTSAPSGTHTFWVQTFGFGDAISLFFNK